MFITLTTSFPFLVKWDWNCTPWIHSHLEPWNVQTNRTSLTPLQETSLAQTVLRKAYRSAPHPVAMHHVEWPCRVFQPQFSVAIYSLPWACSTLINTPISSNMKRKCFISSCVSQPIIIDGSQTKANTSSWFVLSG